MVVVREPKMSTKIVEVIILFAICSSNFVSSNPIEYRIMGGKVADKDHLTFAVSIQSGGRHICGGCLIDKEWVLSAAACFYGKAESSFEVVVGAHKLDSKKAIRIPAVRVVIHEDYNPFNSANDVALIKLYQPVKKSRFVDVIELEERFIGKSKDCFSSGWGLTRYSSSDISNDLRYLPTKTISTRQCQHALRGYPILSSNICTFMGHGRGSCPGDLGSPLVIKHRNKFRVIGVTSWVVSCGKGTPDVYSRVSYYYKWIKNVV